MLVWSHATFLPPDVPPFAIHAIDRTARKEGEPN